MKNMLKAKKNKIYLSIILGIIFLSAIPLYHTQANILVNAIQSTSLNLVKLIFQLIVWVTSWVFKLAIGLLSWVISKDFMPFGYIFNPVTDVGLSITRSFVNLILVVILVYVAISIALRLNEAQSKKLFINLVILALLVNFAPLVVGVVVDAANIITNFFLSGITDLSNFAATLEGFSNNAAAQMDRFRTQKDFSGAMSGIIGQGIGIILFNIIAAILFVLFFCLFLFRYVAIWVIVILSPLAVLCYILPQTKKLFEQWKNSLITWAFISIPVSFFLYLGLRILEILPSQMRDAQLDLVGTDAGVARFFGGLLPYGVVLVFLFIGFMLSLQISAPGTSGFQKKYEKARGKLSVGSKNLSKDFGKGVERTALSSKAGQKAKNALSRTGEGKGIKGTIARTTGLSFLAHKAAAGMAKEDKKLTNNLIEKEEKETKEKFKEKDYIMAYRNYALHQQHGKLGAAKAMAEAGTFGELTEKEQKEAFALADKTGRSDLLLSFSKYNPGLIKEHADGIIDYERDIQKEIQTGLSKEKATKKINIKIATETGFDVKDIEKNIDEAKIQAATNKVIGKLKPEDIGKLKIKKETPEEKKQYEKFLKAIVTQKNFSFLEKMEDEQKFSGISQDIKETLNSDKKLLTDVKRNNPAIILKMYSPAGKIFFGENPVEGKNLEQIIKEINIARGDRTVQQPSRIIDPRTNKPFGAEEFPDKTPPGSLG